MIEQINATGWPELLSGNLVAASFTMYNTSFAGLFPIMILIVYEVLIYIKTRNMVTTMITAMFFGTFLLSVNLVPGHVKWILYLMIVFFAAFTYHSLTSK